MAKFLFKFAFIIPLLVFVCNASAQRGYYDAPYKRYEADKGTLTNATITPKSYKQSDLQCEATDQICVDFSKTDASLEWTLDEAADGLVVRYSVPDGETGVIGVYDGSTKITSLMLTSKWSWEYLWSNGDPNNIGIKNKNPRMRFDEVRFKLPNKLSKLKIVRESGNIWLDFVEMEPVPAAITAPAGSVVYNGNGSTLQAFIDANGAKTIFVPAGIYNINSQIYFGVARTKLQGAGMWYTQLNFTVTNASNGGLRADAPNVSYSDLYLTTDMTTRTKGYGGIIGVYTSESVIQNIWVEHCATGSWIAQFTGGLGPAYADGFLMKNCRFRNTYADGVNLCKGTSNAIVEHCNFRNNGDDGMAIWSAEGLECINNTFRNNTVENVWRAAGIGLYGGKDNKFYNIIIKDNLEIGITVNNFFAGVGFNDNGMHDFHEISVIGCGTFNDTDNSRVGAINISCAAIAGTKVQNLRFNSIDITDSKCDAIRIAKNAGNGIFNLKFENVTVNGTGKEYPNNNVNNAISQTGFAVIFDQYPVGNATYCSLNYSNLGGNSNGTAFNTTLKGNFSWTALTGCDLAAVTGVKLMPSDTSMAGGASLQLVPKFSPTNATNKIVSYTSSNTAVATINYNGLVTSLSKGQTTLTVTTLDGNFSSTCNLNITSTPLTVYKIKNRWQNTYLYDSGGLVKYSGTASDKTYQWKLEDVDGVKEIQNFSTGDYMHIENLLGYVQCTSRTPGAMSSRWSIEDAGDGFVRLKSEWNTLDYMNVEKLQNQAWYSTIEPSWWSAMWLLEPIIIPTSVPTLSLEKTAGIYPNPSNGDFNLMMTDFASNEKVSIAIFNLAGQVLYTNFCSVDENGFKNLKISAGNILPSGDYLVEAKGNLNFSRAKLLISK